MILEFKCSNCDKHLSDVFFEEEQNFFKKMAITCPYCFDRSFQQEVGARYSIMLERDSGVSILDVADNDLPNSLVIVYLTEE